MLYLAFAPQGQDLRDRYPDSTWLVFATMIKETVFTPADVVVVSEWVVPDPAEMMELLYRIRQQGARVIYVGSVQHETDERKRQLALLQIYDFLFFDEEIILGQIDALIDKRRTAKDVETYLTPLSSGGREAPVPAVVDIYEEPTPLTKASLPDHAPSARLGRDRKSVERTAGPTPRKVVWRQTKPVTLQVVGDTGAGVSTILWNLAALCEERELHTAVVENDPLVITAWTDLAQGVHVYATVPMKGYRLVLSSRETEAKAADCTLAVTFADEMRIERMHDRLQAVGVSARHTLWVINHAGPGFSIPRTLRADAVAMIPHDVRQFGATRMKHPLCHSVPAWRTGLSPIVDHLQEHYLAQVRGEKADVALA
ncbi:MAG: hypothetical protein OWT28_08290 [Firmicutes bacterium]|nr:hypothetical protein [Bacillota bacterium]